MFHLLKLNFLSNQKIKQFFTNKRALKSSFSSSHVSNHSRRPQSRRPQPQSLLYPPAFAYLSQTPSIEDVMGLPVLYLKILASRQNEKRIFGQYFQQKDWKEILTNSFRAYFLLYDYY